jgi:hypothetical protein
LKITFILRNGATIDSIIPEEQRKDFNFGAVCGNTRINGYFQTGNMHLQYQDIAGMLFSSDEIASPAVKPLHGGTLQ